MSGGSPSLARSRPMVVLTVVVNRSAFSSHTRSSSSSAVTSAPPAASRHSSTANSFGVRANRRPARTATRLAGSADRSAQVRTGGSGVTARRASARIRATSSAKSNGLGR